jgi:hypothetical protein
MFPTNPHRNYPDTIDRDLDALLEALEGTSRHDKAILAISLCIAHGVNTRSSIIGTLKRKDFKPGHVAHLLNDNTGADPEGNHWFLDPEDLLRCHPEVE